MSLVQPRELGDFLFSASLCFAISSFQLCELVLNSQIVSFFTIGRKRSPEESDMQRSTHII